MSASDGPPPVPERLPWSVPVLAKHLDSELQVLEKLRVGILAKRSKGTSVLVTAGLICLAVGVLGMALLPPVGVAFGIIPFVILQLIGLALVIWKPGIALSLMKSVYDY